MTEKYRGEDAVILMHESGRVLRLDPARYDDDAAKAAKKSGWQRYEVPKDGFRKRRKRTKAEMRELIESGVVATEPQAQQRYSADTFVVDVPLGTLDGAGQEAR